MSPSSNAPPSGSCHSRTGPNSRPLKALLRRVPRLRRTLYGAHRGTFDFWAHALTAPGWRRTAIQALTRLNLRTVRDRGLRLRLTPGYEPMCKRLVVSAGYYRAVQRSGVEVVSEGIDRVETRGIRTRDGRLHELDVIVLATGFDAHAFLRPMEVTGAGGLALESAWRNGPRAHRTVALPGFPNLFLMMGPNSPIGNTSLVPVAEAQAGFILGWVERLRQGAVRTVMPTAEATAAFNAEIRDNMGDTVWVTGCDSWYIGPDGTPTLWPFSHRRFREMLARPDETEYTLDKG